MSHKPRSTEPSGNAEASGRSTQGSWIRAFDSRWHDLTTALVIGAAGLLGSWAAYQGSLWDGVQLASYSRSDALRVRAASAAQDLAMDQTVQMNIVRGWVEAKAGGDERLAEFYAQRVPRELRPAFEEWLKQRPVEDPGAAPGPFALPAYRPTGAAAVARLDSEAEQAFQAALDAKHTADAQHRAGVFLAMAMFFAGIAQVFNRPGVRFALTILGLAAAAAGAGLLISLPALSLQQLARHA